VKDFRCEACGLCCLHVRKFDGYGEAPYQVIATEDGSCVHLDKRTNRCKIYAHRPQVCDVRGMRPRWLPMSWWYALNRSVCRALQIRASRTR
jgi:uncharacterized protein